jgi:hypothetical protein
MIDFIRSYVTAVHNAEAACLQVTFKGFINYDELVEVIAYEFEMIRHYKIRKCLVNLHEMSVYPNGGQEYIKNVWFPQVIKDGMQVAAFVVPDDAFGKMSMQEAHTYPESTMLVKYFNDADHALAWLVTQQV